MAVAIDRLQIGIVVIPFTAPVVDVVNLVGDFNAAKRPAFVALAQAASFAQYNLADFPPSSPAPLAIALRFAGARVESC